MCVTVSAVTLFFNDVISAFAVVSFDVFNEILVALAEMLVVFLDTFEVLAAIAFLSELICNRLSAMSLVFVAIFVVLVDCWLASLVISVVLFVTLFSIFLSVVDELAPPFKLAMDVLITAMSFVFVAMFALLTEIDGVFLAMLFVFVVILDVLAVMLFVFEFMFVALFAMLVVLVAILSLLAAELPPDESVRMPALLLAMSFVFVVIFTLFAVMLLVLEVILFALDVMLVVFVAMLALLAAEVPDVENFVILALFVAMSFVFCVMLFLFVVT